jgi:hypothetical protein
VWIAIIGARSRTPATSDSKVRSNAPAQWATSVDVPPMSNVMMRSNPARPDTRTAPTMPPAGPDRMASLPWKRRASTSPPFDCMNISRTSPSAPAIWST